MTLREAVAILKGHYGPPLPPPTRDPFELVLWENVAYLASPERRLEAFELLRSSVGTSARSILASPPKALERITAHGILKDTFAAKLKECARIAIDSCEGDLAAALRRAPGDARRLLRSFPGIGEPGAEKILLLAGHEAFLAPDSNALRVLVRLGFIEEDPAYARMYAGAREAGRAFKSDGAVVRDAHLLLQHHGKTQCKRTRPLCEACPLRPGCARHGLPRDQALTSGDTRGGPASPRRTSRGRST